MPLLEEPKAEPPARPACSNNHLPRMNPHPKQAGKSQAEPHFGTPRGDGGAATYGKRHEVRRWGGKKIKINKSRGRKINQPPPPFFFFPFWPPNFPAAGPRAGRAPPAGQQRPGRGAGETSPVAAAPITPAALTWPALRPNSGP